MKYLFILPIFFLFYADISAQSENAAKDEVWQRELQYWQYVKNNDTVGYRTLWHDDFVGYPDSEKLTGKAKIANWITEAHNAKGRRYDFSLDKKMVNAFGDVVITFYDETDIWKNDKNELVLEEVYKITHTWKKFGDKWLIIGGMSALKRKQ